MIEREPMPDAAAPVVPGEPVLVVDIETHGHGYERLRQPSFQGVRSDLSPDDLRWGP